MTPGWTRTTGRVLGALVVFLVACAHTDPNVGKMEWKDKPESLSRLIRLEKWMTNQPLLCPS